MSGSSRDSISHFLASAAACAILACSAATTAAGLPPALEPPDPATLREARGVDYPDPVEAARLAEAAGAVGITVHLRQDRRHINDRDLRLLRETVTVDLNLEMSLAEEIVAIASPAYVEGHGRPADDASIARR